ncbi:MULTISPECIES: hypothetical protein [unclassified Streptomyces]|uniref:hypothetical protein n=1 Tax=Streptomyces TaxID=1883 RepID=UPI0025B2F56E|nr:MULTISPECIES: hypothetical protein [unclassified Streptomyces]MDN3250438.1 hypothetical protein [Streptomyces sp. ZSW22]MDN3258010.1 hypothetical protein [Streptomyces sp. MA25(2023)]
MSTTPPDGRRVTPRRLGAAAAIYGVFVAGWYLGQPVSSDCRVDRAAVDRAVERYGTEQSPTFTPPVSSPTSLPTPAPSAYRTHDSLDDAGTGMSETLTAYAVVCTNDTSERPRLEAWSEGDWR